MGEDTFPQSGWWHQPWWLFHSQEGGAGLPGVRAAQFPVRTHPFPAGYQADWEMGAQRDHPLSPQICHLCVQQGNDGEERAVKGENEPMAAPWAGTWSYSQLCYSQLCYSQLCYPQLCYNIPSYAIPSYDIPSYAIPSYVIPSWHSQLCYDIPSYVIPSYVVTFPAMLFPVMTFLIVLCYSQLCYSQLFCSSKAQPSSPGTQPPQCPALGRCCCLLPVWGMLQQRENWCGIWMFKEFLRHMQRWFSWACSGADFGCW